ALCTRVGVSSSGCRVRRKWGPWTAATARARTAEERSQHPLAGDRVAMVPGAVVHRELRSGCIMVPPRPGAAPTAPAPAPVCFAAWAAAPRGAILRTTPQGATDGPLEPPPGRAGRGGSQPRAAGGVRTAAGAGAAPAASLPGRIPRALAVPTYGDDR